MHVWIENFLSSKWILLPFQWCRVHLMSWFGLFSVESECIFIWRIISVGINAPAAQIRWFWFPSQDCSRIHYPDGIFVVPTQKTIHCIWSNWFIDKSHGIWFWIEPVVDFGYSTAQFDRNCCRHWLADIESGDSGVVFVILVADP